MINEKIRDKLREFNVNEDEGLLYLLGVFYNLKTSGIIPEETIKQVNFSKIVTRDYEGEVPSVLWNIPLFEGQVYDSNWQWVLEWRMLFMEIRGDAGGDRKGCIDKMKKFFSQHPEVRKDEVFDAANMYLDEFRYGSKRETKYLQQADYFISKINREEGTNIKRSRLEQYVELVRNKKKAAEGGEASRHMGGMMS